MSRRFILRIGWVLLSAGLLGLSIMLIRTLQLPPTDPAFATFQAAGKVRAIMFSPDGTLLASLESDTVIRLRHIPDGTITQMLTGHTAEVQSMAFSPDGLLLVSAGGDGIVRVWNSHTGTVVTSWTVDTTTIPAVAFNPAGDMVVAALGNPFTEGAHGYLQRWQIADYRALPPLAPQTPPVTNFVFSTDGRYVITNNVQAPFQIWQMDTGQLVGHAKETSAVSAYRSAHFYLHAVPQADLMIADSNRRTTIDMWRITDGDYLGVLGKHDGQLWSLAVSADGQFVASGSGSPGYLEGNKMKDASIRVWRVGDRTLFKRIEAHNAEIKALAFSPNGQLLASGSDDQTIKLWKLE